MVWVVQLEEVIDGKLVSRTEVATLDRPGHLESLEDLGGFGLNRRFYALTTKSPFLRTLMTTAIQRLSGSKRVASALEDRGLTPRRGRLLLHRWEARKPPNAGRGRSIAILERLTGGNIANFPRPAFPEGLRRPKSYCIFWAVWAKNPKGKDGLAAVVRSAIVSFEPLLDEAAARRKARRPHRI
jgi:hypothetical protein